MAGGSAATREGWKSHGARLPVVWQTLSEEGTLRPLLPVAVVVAVIIITCIKKLSSGKLDYLLVKGEQEKLAVEAEGNTPVALRQPAKPVPAVTASPTGTRPVPAALSVCSEVSVAPGYTVVQ